MHALDAGQVMKLLATAEATKNRWTALWAVLGTGRLRPSEALALRWEYVLADRVRVHGALVMEGGGWSISECKTAKSRRVVPLPPKTMEALRWHQTQQAIERETAGTAYRDVRLVFTSQTGGPCDFKNAVARWFHPLVKAAGLPPIRAYDLRHSFASNALAAGISVLVVSELLGHASAKMTLDVYGHVLAGEREGAADKLAAYFEAANSDQRVQDLAT
jgi:integrase